MQKMADDSACISPFSGINYTLLYNKCLLDFSEYKTVYEDPNASGGL